VSLREQAGILPESEEEPDYRWKLREQVHGEDPTPLERERAKTVQIIYHACWSVLIWCGFLTVWDPVFLPPMQKTYVGDLLGKYQGWV
jgi:hypothetical protein